MWLLFAVYAIVFVSGFGLIMLCGVCSDKYEKQPLMIVPALLCVMIGLPLCIGGGLGIFQILDMLGYLPKL